MNNKPDYYILEDFKRYNPSADIEWYRENMTNEEAENEFRQYYSENNLNVDVTTWVRVNQASPEMYWKGAFEDQVCFIRDKIGNMIGIKAKNRNEKTVVISTHRSKSILLPVYQIEMSSGIIVTIRDNFYDYKVSIDSPHEIHFDFMERVDTSQKWNSCYCEGFPEELVFDSYDSNKKQFTFQIGNKYDLYMVMFLLNKQINKEDK